MGVATGPGAAAPERPHSGGPWHHESLPGRVICDVRVRSHLQLGLNRPLWASLQMGLIFSLFRLTRLTWERISNNHNPNIKSFHFPDFFQQRIWLINCKFYRYQLTTRLIDCLIKCCYQNFVPPGILNKHFLNGLPLKSCNMCKYFPSI